MAHMMPLTKHTSRLHYMNHVVKHLKSVSLYSHLTFRGAHGFRQPDKQGSKCEIILRLVSTLLLKLRFLGNKQTNKQNIKDLVHP